MSQKLNNESGFTFIELLVVTLILGVLSSLALPGFSGQKDKGFDARAKTSISAATGALEAYRVEHDDYGATQADLAQIDPSVGGAVGLTITGDGDTFRVAVESASGHVFAVERAAGVVSRSCTPAGEGGCLPDGTW